MNKKLSILLLLILIVNLDAKMKNTTDESPVYKLTVQQMFDRKGKELSNLLKRNVVLTTSYLQTEDPQKETWITMGTIDNKPIRATWDDAMWYITIFDEEKTIVVNTITGNIEVQDWNNRKNITDEKRNCGCKREEAN